MASVAQIVIEVNDNATPAFQKLNAETAKLQANMQPVARVSEQTFNNIEGGALKARESAALLGEEFGVKIPRALRGTIAQSELLGPAFEGAFKGLAILGMIEIIKTAIDKLTGFSAALAVIQKQNDELMQSIGAANKTLIGPQSLKQVNEEAVKTQKAIEGLNVQLGMTGNVYGDSLTRGLTKYNQQQRVLLDTLDEQKKHLNDLQAEQARLLDEERRTEPIEILKLQNAARLDGLQGINKINEAERGATAVIRAEMAARIVTFGVGNAEIKEIQKKAIAERTTLERDVTNQDTKAYLQAKINAASTYEAKFDLAKGEQKIYQELNLKLFEIDMEEYQKGMKLDGLRVAAKMEAAAQIEELGHRHAVKMRLMEDETLNIEKAAAVATAPPWERANMQIVQSYQECIAKIKLELDAGRLDSDHAARQAAAAWQEAFAQMRNKLASDMETLFDNITSGNIGKFFLTQLKHMIFQMVAAWVLGLQQMKSAANQTMNSGGGILGSIFGSLGLGGIFGGGAGGGAQGSISSIPGVITNFNDYALPEGASPGISAGLSSVLGLSAGGGAGAGTTLPSGAGAPGASTGGLLGGLLGPLLGKLPNILGSQLGAGLAVAGIGLFANAFGKGGWLRGLEGAAGGALTGLMVGGPIGALIGGIIGFFGGFFQHSTRKARLAIEANIKAQAKTIEDSYNLFQSDWTSSRTALEQLRQQGVDALKQAGVKDINRSRVGHVDQWVDKAEKEIDATQAERNRRAALVFGAPQFRFGGFVGPSGGGAIPSWFAGTAMHFASGGAVPAILHEGEYVMRPEAVSRIGVGNLHHMNSGGGGGDTYVVNLSAWDGQSVQEWLDNGGMDKIASAHRRGVAEGRY